MPRKSNKKKRGGGTIRAPFRFKRNSEVFVERVGYSDSPVSNPLRSISRGPVDLTSDFDTALAVASGGRRSRRRNSNKKYKPYGRNSNKKYKPYGRNSNKKYKPYRKNSNKKYGGSKSKKMRGGACPGCVGLNGFDTSSRQRSTFDIRGRV